MQLKTSLKNVDKHVDMLIWMDQKILSTFFQYSPYTFFNNFIKGINYYKSINLILYQLFNSRIYNSRKKYKKDYICM